jgi:hypothetical protein
MQIRKIFHHKTERMKHLFFNFLTLQQNYLKVGCNFLKHFHRNNSIHKILTTPSYGLKERYCLSLTNGGTGGGGGGDAAQLYLFVPIPAKAKKLGLLSIYKFSLTITYRVAVYAPA